MTRIRAIEYVRVAEADGRDPGPPDECWAEFEALDDAVDEDRLTR